MLTDDMMNITAALFAIVAVFRYLYICKQNNLHAKLEILISHALAASSIPTGFLLVAASVYPNIIKSIDGLNLYFSVAGMSLIYIAIRQIKASVS
ncbi:hypothetical protein [Vibrio owensii]|uniref:hypothetical protein n=1 Tax=Vibrio owensii TaxID=696485 RepID=UPI003918C64A